MRKTDYPIVIAELLGIPELRGQAGPWMSNQGTVMAEWVHAVADRLGVAYVEKVQTMRALIEAVGEEWDARTMASTLTSSRGGGNISTPAFAALLRGLERSELATALTPYQWADEEVRRFGTGLHLTDLLLAERSTQAHARIQNQLAQWLLDRGIEPLSPAFNQPLFDLAWSHRGEIYVGEVKSIQPENELHQLRLGLGQVLDYAHTLEARPVLIVERYPSITRWDAVCYENGVTLTWPGAFDRLLA